MIRVDLSSRKNNEKWGDIVYALSLLSNRFFLPLLKSFTTYSFSRNYLKFGGFYHLELQEIVHIYFEFSIKMSNFNIFSIHFDVYGLNFGVFRMKLQTAIQFVFMGS